MAHVINQDKCAGCGSCAEACPTECIVEKDGKYKVQLVWDGAQGGTVTLIEVTE